MADKKQDIQKILDEAQTVDADDPDMLNKLNELAKMVAEKQGKVSSKVPSGNNSKIIDPMDELGCEGCQ